MVFTNEQQKNLYFIIGVGRSGTSLIQELLSVFRKKKPIWLKLYEDFTRKKTKSGSFCHAGESTIKDPYWKSFWAPVKKSNDFTELEQFIENNWSEECFIEKTPDSITCLPQMLKNYPKSNYIFIQRNPYDIVLSQLNLFPENQDYEMREFHLSSLVMDKKDMKLNHEQYWSKYTLERIKEMIANKKYFVNSVTIKYEDLIRFPEKELRKLEKKFKIEKNEEVINDILNHQKIVEKLF